MGTQVRITTCTEEVASNATRDPHTIFDSVDDLREAASGHDAGWLDEKLSHPQSSRPERSARRDFGPGVRANTSGVTVELPETWQQLQACLLRKTKKPAARFLESGGTALPPVEGQPSVRVFAAAEVGQVAAVLLEMTRHDVSGHVESASDEPQQREHLLDLFDILRRFFAEASSHQLAAYLVVTH